MPGDHIPFSPVEKLRFGHETEAFDCDKAELNRFLSRFAFVNQRANTAQTYVVCRGTQVVGYYSLTVGQADHKDAPARISQGMARHPIPLMGASKASVWGPRCSRMRCCVAQRRRILQGYAPCLSMPRTRRLRRSIGISTSSPARPTPIICFC